MWIFEGFLTLCVDLFYIVLAKLLNPSELLSTWVEHAEYCSSPDIAAFKLLLCDGRCVSGIVFPVFSPSNFPTFCSCFLSIGVALDTVRVVIPFFSQGAQLDNSSAQSG